MKHLAFAIPVSMLLYGADVAAQTPVMAQGAKVQVTLRISAKTPSFTNQRLVVRLAHDHPTQKDRGDTAVDNYIDKKFSHEKGKDTVLTITLGEKNKVNPSVQYAVSATVFDAASRRTHFAELKGESGPFRVLTNNAPNKLAVVVRPALSTASR